MSASTNKKRHVISYEKLSGSVADAFSEQYPTDEAISDALVKYPRPGGQPFYAVTLELEEDIYLVKIDVSVDTADDVNKWLESEAETEAEKIAGTNEDSGSGDGETLPDENISQYGTDEEGQENS